MNETMQHEMTPEMVTVEPSSESSYFKECLSKDNRASSEEPPFRRRWLKRREEEREETAVPLMQRSYLCFFHAINNAHTHAMAQI